MLLPRFTRSFAKCLAALSAGAVDHMTYSWQPTWNELGQCAFAPSPTACDNPATLDGLTKPPPYRDESIDPDAADEEDAGFVLSGNHGGDHVAVDLR